MTAARMKGSNETLDKLKYVPIAGLGLAAGSALAALIAGPGSRFGVWHWRIGFTILEWSAYVALAAAAIAVVGIGVARLRFGWRYLVGGIAGLAIGVGVAAVPWSYRQKAAELPKINDITTDTESPPGVIALLAHRKGAKNLTWYPGKVVATQQKKAYPDIEPVVLRMPPAQAFDRARKAVQRMGWTVVAATAPATNQDGRIEAYDRTFWFGFTDDVVVRVRPGQGGSRIDLRSVSRVGQHDFGTNAARVRAFLAAVKS